MQKKKILIPLDLSVLSVQILETVRRLFSPNEAQITLLSAISLLEMSPTVPTSVVGSRTDLYPPQFDHEEWKVLQRDTESELERIAKELRTAGYEVRTNVVTGDPVREIVDLSEQKGFDLIAMATHGRTGVSRMIMGSVAEDVLRATAVPVLLLRPQMEQKA